MLEKLQHKSVMWFLFELVRVRVRVCSFFFVCVLCVCICVFDACVSGSALSLHGQTLAAMPSRIVALAFQSNFKKQG